MNHSLQCYETPQDVYARHLSSRRGYPLWMPEVKAELPKDYQDHGLKIGDVGYVVPEQGCFEVLFNITLPLDHDLHRDRPLPKNFQPISLNEALDITTYPGAEAAGNVIKSTSVTTVEVSPEEQPSDYKFTFSSSEGALLILPHGADQRSLHRYQSFGLYAMRHAVEWYRYVEEDLERIISNNSLYLITGFYKSRSWALAAFEGAEEPGNIPAQFKITQPEGGTLVRGYRWTTTRHSESRVGPELYTGKTNQAVYIRGFKIAVRDEPLGRKQIMVRADHPSVEPRREEFSDIVDVQEPDELQSDTPGNLAHTSDGDSKDKGMLRTIRRVSVQSMPQVSDPFHPSDIINKYLLQKAPSATVAITHDSQWATLLKSTQGALEPWELADEHMILEALSKQYVVALKDGAVFLRSVAGTNDTLDMEGYIKEEALTKQQPLKMLGVMGRDIKARGRTPTLLKGHEGCMTLVAFVSDDHIISASNQDRTIRQWSYSDTRWRNEVLKEAMAVCGAATSPDRRWVAYGGADGRVRLIDLATQKITKSDARHADMVQSVSFSPDSSELASGARDGTLLRWSLNSLQPTAESSKRHSDSVWCIRYSPNGRKIASCDRQIIQIRDFVTRAKLAITEQAWSLAWSTSSESCFLLAGCIDGSLRRFDPNTGETLTICHKAHQDVIFSIALPHNANFIATASWDRTVRFWEATTFQEIAPCLRHDVNVHSISISPSDDYLVSGARDTIVRIWNLKAIVPAFVLPISLQPPQPQRKRGFHLPFLNLHFTSDPPTGAVSVIAGLIHKIRSHPFDLSGKIIPEGKDPVSGGSHGDIYRGMLNIDGSTMRVAIKVIKRYTAQGDDESKNRRLRREIKLWKTLEHRNVLPLLGTSTDYGAFEAMVCPWVENGALTIYLESHKDELTEQQRFGVIGDIASGLHYLHSRSIVHGDISGSNVLVDESGRACIADFGLSIVSTDLGGSSMALTYQLKGTLRYTAPELLFGIFGPSRDNDSVSNEDESKVFPTVQSDIYSFGGIMLQTLTGKIPYHYLVDGQVILAISKGEYPRRPKSSGVVTDAQWEFMTKCWSFEPMDRPPDADMVAFVMAQSLDAVAL